MVNLLPPETLRRARTEYYLRLTAACLLLLSLVLFANAVFMVPSYLFARVAARVSAERYQLLMQGDETDTAATGPLLAQTSDLIAAALAPHTKFMPVLEDVLSARPRGVAITRVLFERGDVSRLSLGGTAATRDALLSFKRSLEEGASFTSVELPLSNLSRATDIEFSMTLLLTRP